MKNLFERGAVDEVVSRIDQLQPGAQGQWGKMDVAQMMPHCSAALDMASGRINPPRIFLGRLIGALVKPIYTNEKPFSRNNPTDKALVVSDQRDFRRDQEQLRSKLRQFHEGGEAECTRRPHLFFGALHTATVGPGNVQAYGSPLAAVWGMTPGIPPSEAKAKLTLLGLAHD